MWLEIHQSFQADSLRVLMWTYCCWRGTVARNQNILKQKAFMLLGRFGRSVENIFSKKRNCNWSKNVFLNILKSWIFGLSCGLPQSWSQFGEKWSNHHLSARIVFSNFRSVIVVWSSSREIMLSFSYFKPLDAATAAVARWFEVKAPSTIYSLQNYFQKYVNYLFQTV